jgi:hypothetical protein
MRDGRRTGRPVVPGRGIAALALLVAGCAWLATQPPEPEGWLERLGEAPPPPAGDALPLPPPQLERLMTRAELEFRGHERLASGVTGAARVTLHFPSIDRELDFKWRTAPAGDADGWNNSPRKELAAYAIQKWFLDPEHYVVPPTVLRCIPFEAYQAVDPQAAPTIPGTRCVLGLLAAWLHDVAPPDRVYDPQRFYRDGAYATHLAHFNLLTYLVEHRDTRAANVLASRDASNRRVFAVDNGIAFGGRLYNFFKDHWDDLRVPALPRRSVERLRRVGPDELRALAVVEQLRRGEDGVLHPVRHDAPIDPERGTRRRDGVLQLGLTEDEIEDVGERLEELLDDVEDGEPPLF